MLELIQKIKTYAEAGIILEHMELFDELLDYPELQVPFTDEELIKMGVYNCEVGKTCYIGGYGCVRKNHDNLNKYFKDTARLFLYECYADMSFKFGVSDGRKCYFEACEYENIEFLAERLSNLLYKREA